MSTRSAGGLGRRWVRVTRAAAALAVTAGMCTLAAGPAATATSAEPGAAPPPYGTIWAVDDGGSGQLAEFPPGATGNVPPEATITGSATGLDEPFAAAIDTLGRVWVSNFAGDSITAYGPHDSGNVLPAVSISGKDTTLNLPAGIAISPAGDIWVANYSADTIVEFAAGSYGNVAPIRIIRGPRANLRDLTGLALSPGGKDVWVTEDVSPGGALPALEEFSTSARNDAKPLVRLTGSKTMLTNPTGITINRTGGPITDTNTSAPFSLQQFASGAHGNVSPSRTLTGANTALDEPSMLSSDAHGGTWVADFGGKAVARFGPGQAGNVQPLQIVSGNLTGLDAPVAVAVYGTPPGSPRSVHGRRTRHAVHLTWRAPRLSGGAILGYLLRSARSKTGRWTTVATTSKRSFTQHHAKPGRFYDVEAFNALGYSSPTPALLPRA
jgi:streptogramin lyase